MDFTKAEVILSQLDGFRGELIWFEEAAQEEHSKKAFNEINRLQKEIKQTTDMIRFGGYKRVKNLEEKYEEFKRKFLELKKEWETKADEYRKNRYGDTEITEEQ